MFPRSSWEPRQRSLWDLGHNYGFYDHKKGWWRGQPHTCIYMHGMSGIQYERWWRHVEGRMCYHYNQCWNFERMEQENLYREFEAKEENRALSGRQAQGPSLGSCWCALFSPSPSQMILQAIFISKSPSVIPFLVLQSLATPSSQHGSVAHGSSLLKHLGKFLAEVWLQRWWDHCLSITAIMVLDGGVAVTMVMLSQDPPRVEVTGALSI